MPHIADSTSLQPAPADVTQSLPDYCPWLDVLRFVACFLVIVLHCVPQAPAALGHAGVALFFSISGFLIGRVLIRDSVLVHFYSRRWLRIYPAYATTLLLTAALFLMHFGAKPDIAHLFLINLPYYFTFTFQLSPDAARLPLLIVWTLCVEELFYLLLPLIFLLRKRRAIALAMFSVLILLCVPQFAKLPDGSGTWYLFPLNLFVGVLLALSKPRLSRWSLWLAPLCFLLLMGNVYWTWFSSFGPVGALLTTAIVWSLAASRTPLPRFAEIARTLGGLSYGMYLLHLLGISLVLRFTRSFEASLPPLLYLTLLVMVVTSVTAMLAWAMKRFVEDPALRLRKHLSSDKPLARALSVLQVSLIPAGIAYALLQARHH